MKKKLFVCIVVVLFAAGLAGGQQGEITGSFELVYLSKWLSKGSSVWGQQGGFFESVNLNLWDSGFGTYVTHRHSTGNNHIKERYDYGVYYKDKMFEDSLYLMNYKLRWAYEHYPNIARNRYKTTNEWAFTFSWPKLFGKGLIPQYIAYYEYPAGSNYANHNDTGWVHQFGLGYDLSAAGFLPDVPEQTIHLTTSLSYRDNLGGKSKDNDWSHATFGASTKIRLAEDISLIPALYYQISMDDDVSSRDHLYTTMCMRYQF